MSFRHWGHSETAQLSSTQEIRHLRRRKGGREQGDPSPSFQPPGAAHDAPALLQHPQSSPPFRLITPRSPGAHLASDWSLSPWTSQHHFGQLQRTSTAWAWICQVTDSRETPSWNMAMGWEGDFREASGHRAGEGHQPSSPHPSHK